MNEDQIILLICFLIYWVTLVIIAICSENRKKVLFTNLSIHILYSSYFLYGLAFKSQYGAGLVWLIFLMFAIGLHWLINLVATLRVKKQKYQ